ncbi:MAG: phosphomannomutase/phosphoglucomutase [Nanoarchaeota archaeon]
MGEPFHKYDIRGIYPKDLSEDLVYRIAKAIVKRFSLKRIIVGYDHRMSSPSLFESFSRGAADMGCDVLSIGSTATPILYHFCVKEKFDIGVMITASHNPKEYNGIKVCTKESQLITYDKGLSDVEGLAVENKFPDADMKGKIETRDVLNEYVSFIIPLLSNLKKNYKVVIDTGNGVAGPIVEKILNGIENIDVIPLFFELDGNYPNHEANPLKDENLVDLSKKIIETKSDFGFAFDGDGDRCILLDEKGEVVNTDILLCLIATEESKKNPGSTFYYDLRFSKIVKEHIESLGCKAVMSEVGNAVYKEKLVYEGGLVAAELSGHVMYSDNSCLDDGFYLMAKIFGYVDNLVGSVSKLVLPYKKYFQSPEINTKVKDANVAIEDVRAKYKDYEITEIDGVTITADNWWFNLRKSNTEPVVRMRVEADTKELLDEKIKELQNLLALHK